jgi:hypothetical protein
MARKKNTKSNCNFYVQNFKQDGTLCSTGVVAVYDSETNEQLGFLTLIYDRLYGPGDEFVGTITEPVEI